jgi:hypothetical protein
MPEGGGHVVNPEGGHGVPDYHRGRRETQQHVFFLLLALGVGGDHVFDHFLGRLLDFFHSLFDFVHRFFDRLFDLLEQGPQLAGARHREGPVLVDAKASDLAEIPELTQGELGADGVNDR